MPGMSGPQDRDDRLPVSGSGGEPTRRYWNDRHAGATWSEEPAAWLLEQHELLVSQSPGRALDIACGGARNALFLAELGFEVDALDISDIAVERVRRLASERGAAIAALRTDLAARQRFPRAPYSVVIDFFYLERSLLAPIIDALQPGGLLLFETFVGGRPSGQTSGTRFGLHPGELRRAFATLELLHYEEVEIGSERSGHRMVARMAARRRPSR